MNVVVLNYSDKKLDGVSQAFAGDNLETVNARATSTPVEDVIQLIKGYKTDLVTVIELKKDGQPLRAPAAIDRIRHAAKHKQQPVRIPILFLGNFKDGDLNAVYEAGATATPPLDFDILSGALSIKSCFLHQQAKRLVAIAGGGAHETFGPCGSQLTTHPVTGRVLFLDEDLRLTADESLVMKALMQAKGRRLSRETLQDERHGYGAADNDRDGGDSDRNIDVVIKRIRHKMNMVLDRKRGEIGGLDIKAKDIVAAEWCTGYYVDLDSLKKLSHAVEHSTPPVTLSPGDLLTIHRGQVMFLGEDLKTTPKENTWLTALIEMNGKCLSKQASFDALGGQDARDVVIPIRKKMDAILESRRTDLAGLDIKAADIIDTEYGVGNRLNPDNLAKLSHALGQSTVTGFYGLVQQSSKDFTLFDYPLKLTPREGKLLNFLMQAPDGLKSWEQIRDHIYHPGADIAPSTIRVVIFQLNSQIKASLREAGHLFNLPVIEAIPTEGWRLSAANLRQLAQALALKTPAGAPAHAVSHDGSAHGPSSADAKDTFLSHGFSFDRLSGKVWFRNERLNLPSTSTDLWFNLLRAEGQILSRDKLYEACGMEGISINNVAAYMHDAERQITSELKRLGYSTGFPFINMIGKKGWAANIDNLVMLESMPHKPGFPDLRALDNQDQRRNGVFPYHFPVLGRT